MAPFPTLLAFATLETSRHAKADNSDQIDGDDYPVNLAHVQLFVQQLNLANGRALSGVEDVQAKFVRLH